MRSSDPEKMMKSMANKAQHATEDTILTTPISKWLKAMQKMGKIKPGGKLMFIDRNKS